MDGKILVTGGAGYIGSHVVAALADAGYASIILDSFVTSSRAVVPRLSALTGYALDLVEADVRDAAALRRTFHDHAIAAVVHCAALKGVADGEETDVYGGQAWDGISMVAHAMAQAIGACTVVATSTEALFY